MKDFEDRIKNCPICGKRPDITWDYGHITIACFEHDDVKYPSICQSHVYPYDDPLDKHDKRIIRLWNYQVKKYEGTNG